MKEKNYNLMISTTGNYPPCLTGGGVAIDVSGYVDSTMQKEFVLANMSMSCNYGTFSENSFSEFETKIVSEIGLFSNTYFPSQTYGIDLTKTPNYILESNALTSIEKNALSVALSSRDAGYFVIAIVSSEQNVYKVFLNKYNIPFKET